MNKHEGVVTIKNAFDTVILLVKLSGMVRFRMHENFVKCSWNLKIAKLKFYTLSWPNIRDAVIKWFTVNHT